jgi:hypothetical protein
MTGGSSIGRKGTGFRDFVQAFGGRWFVAMSGPLSVPLGFIAYLVQNDAAKILLLVTAISCVIYSSYRVWKTERENANFAHEALEKAQETLKPKAILVLESKMAVEAGGAPDALTRCMLVVAENCSSATLNNCQLLVSGRPASSTFTLRPGEKRLLPIIRIVETTVSGSGDFISRALVHVYYFNGTEWTLWTTKWVIPPGDYEIKLLSDCSMPSAINVQLVHDKDWKLIEL